MRILISAIALVLLCSVSLSAAPMSGFKQPVMTFSATDYDFGIITISQKMSHAFVFRNTGTEDLLILKISPA